MASTTALFTGLSGMNANARNIDVVGNNIANVNTTAYKSNRLMFSTVFSRTLGLGNAPTDVSGGTNPFQIGLGVQAAGTQRNMTSGSVSATGDARDLAIDGGGFFIVNNGDRQAYTRAGAFRQNQYSEIVDISGNRLQGYGVDENYNIETGQLVNLKVPIGERTLAQPTNLAAFSGVLNAGGAIATQGSILNLAGVKDHGLQTISGAAPAPTPPNKVEGATRLIDLENTEAIGTNLPLFAVGQSFDISRAKKGGREVPSSQLEVTATTTMQDLADFLSEALGINTSVPPNPDGKVPGVTVDAANGGLTIVGNTGTANKLDLKPEHMRVLDTDGTVLLSPFKAPTAIAADGESVRTTFLAYDSLGARVSVDVTLTLESQSTGGTTWRYYVESADDSDIQQQLATGTLNFDTRGQLINTEPVSISLDRAGLGAGTPMTFDISFAGDGGSGVTSLASSASTLRAISVDGYEAGTLESYAVGQDGTLVGGFSNGQTRVLGQVVLATFANPEGLVDDGNNLFAAGGNSGSPIVTTPGSFGGGVIIGGALELSNVDLGEEFIKLILSSTGYSASSRVIKTTDDLMQQLLVLGR